MWDDKRSATEPLLKKNDGEYGRKLENDPHFRGMKEEGRKFNDILFGVLFLLVCAASVAISSIGFSHGDPGRLVPSDEVTNDAKVQSEYWFQDSVAKMKRDVDVMGGALVLAIVLGIIWVQLMRMFTKLFIYLTLFIGVALVVAAGVYLFFIGGTHQNNSLRIISYCTFGVAALLILGIIFLRNKIALTCELFKESCAGVQYNPSIGLVALLVVAMFSLFVVYWTASFIYLYSIPKDSKVQLPHTPPSFDQTPRNLMFFQVFVFFWVTSFLSAVFQFSAAGGIATWYFSRDVEGFGRDIGSPTLRSFGRAWTKSFGSLALGSLILAIVKFINFMLRLAKKKNQVKNPVVTFIINCISCIFGLLQRLVKFINRYTYVYIAMHGDSFCGAARECFNLLSRNFFSAAVVDLLGEFVLFVGKLLGTAACVLFTLGVLQAIGRSVSSVTIVMVAVIAFAIFSIFAHIVGVGVDTVMVCYLEDLERNKDGALYISPDLHKMLQEKSEKNIN